nr:PREDICTED: POU domain, class 4, transcription factor 1 [Bos indicus]
MMSMNSKQPHFAMHPTLPEHKYPSLHSSSEAIRRACLPTPPVSAPSPRTRPARPPPSRLRDAACRVLMCAQIPVRGCAGGASASVSGAGDRSGERWGQVSRLPSTFSVDFMPWKGGLCSCSADPRELEAFAERFKQRRIKLGVTQADVGSALANLKIPGVGSLSQSTICRFESLTLSHNNMIALKPILQAWLEEAEGAQREKMNKPELFNGGEKKRKRTSIAAPEKRSLEAYFAVQPRPSSEKIAAIAEKLDLKKNVVRVWFCNQRQKQKRMKFSATY